ncbi:MAG TPA: thymidine kinase [Oligoflexus sp.]|uniref:thymidine kinase n=1 Tax=Oligoflexus sp. TaxID=1971216 RepID=UPI002D4A617D|nr:thymidine kinase [Oligoflexus sp.]HYX32218.1 thymidine kinase [Oligoflexus sp.]
MAKLYFRYGTVGSAKTLNLLAVAHAYQQQDKRVFLIKPRMDTRFGAGVIRSRAGLTRDADLLVDDKSQLELSVLRGYHCVLVDEAQFLTPHVIEQLRQVTRLLDVPVICYGLRTDFRTQLFPGAQRLMELADALEEIKTTCAFCNKKAVFNLKLLGGKPTLAGPTVELGAEEKYLPSCCDCYFSAFQKTHPTEAESPSTL